MIWLSSHLTYHLKISDSDMWKRLQNVYSQIKQNRLKPLSQSIWQPPPLYPVSYQPPTHRSYLCFLYVSHHRWRLLCHHKSTIGIHSYLQCDFQSLVHSDFLEIIILSSSWSKDSLYPDPGPGQPSYHPFYHIRSNERSNELLLSYDRWFQGEKYRSPPPVRQLNVSDLLRTDLTEVYCWKVS